MSSIAQKQHYRPEETGLADLLEDEWSLPQAMHTALSVALAGSACAGHAHSCHAVIHGRGCDMSCHAVHTWSIDASACDQPLAAGVVYLATL